MQNGPNESKATPLSSSAEAECASRDLGEEPDQSLVFQARKLKLREDKQLAVASGRTRVDY